MTNSLSYSSKTMTTSNAITRLRTLLMWSSPVLALVLLFGLGAQPLHATTTSPSSAPLSKPLSETNGLAGAIPVRGAIGRDTPREFVPLTRGEWSLHAALAVRVTLWCNGRARPVSSNFSAVGSSCQVELFRRGPTTTWTLQPVS